MIPGEAKRARAARRVRREPGPSLALTMRPSHFPDGRPCVVLDVGAAVLPLDEIALARFKKELDAKMSEAWRAKLLEVF